VTHTQYFTSVSLPFLLAALLTSGCANSSLQRADRLAQEGKWEEAVVAYREASKDDPYDAEIQRHLDEAKSQAADQHYAQGKQLLSENNILGALREFKIALGFDPSRRIHQTAVGDTMRLKFARDQLQAGKKLQSVGRLDEALTAYEQAAEADPDLADALAGITQVTAQQLSAKSHGTSSQPITLRFQNAKLKEVFEVIARSADLNVIFDKEVQNEPITVFIKDMSFDEALNLIMNTNNVMAQRINRNTLLILPHSKPKQVQYQDLMIRTFYLSHARAKDVANLVRMMIESKRVYVDEKINALVIREDPTKLQLAERALNTVDRPDPEVLLDVEILEVDRAKSLKYGVNFAKVVGAAVAPPGFTGTVSPTSPITSQFTFEQLASLGTGSYLFTIPGSVLVDFFRNDTNAKTLAAPKLRVLNNRPATIQIGDKQPILLSTTNVLPGQAATGAVPTTSTVTSIEFKDTGVKLTVEPIIHLDDQLTLKLKVEVTRLGDRVTLQASPLITQFRFGTRTAETVLMLRDDETIVLGGLIQDEVKKARQSVPILGDIPLIGQLFSTTDVNTITTEVILTITPHIIRKLDTPGLEAQAFWSGTESEYATIPLFTPHVIPTAHKLQPPSTDPRHLSAIAPPLPSSRPIDERDSQDKERSAAKAIPMPRESGPIPSPQRSEESPDIVARIEQQLRIAPGDLSATTGQELRLDIEGAMLNNLVGSIARVTYDSAGLKFLRVASGAAQVATSATTGQIDLAIQAADNPSNTVAGLIFQAVTPGTHTIRLRQLTPLGESMPEAPDQKVTIYVQ
jgi:general secretion pathway protein D